MPTDTLWEKQHQREIVSAIYEIIGQHALHNRDTLLRATLDAAILRGILSEESIADAD